MGCLRIPCQILVIAHNYFYSKNISVTDESSVTLSPSEVDLDIADVVSGMYLATVTQPTELESKRYGLLFV